DQARNVRFGSKADICGATRDVRFGPIAVDHKQTSLDHKQTFRSAIVMSALPPKADMGCPYFFGVVEYLVCSSIARSALSHISLNRLYIVIRRHTYLQNLLTNSFKIFSQICAPPLPRHQSLNFGPTPFTILRNKDSKSDQTTNQQCADFNCTRLALV